MNFTGERVVPGKTPENVYQEHVARYNFALSYAAGKSVLDVACGTGYGTQILARVAASVLGIDIDEETVLYARRNFPHVKVTYRVGDICKLPLPDESVEAVTCYETVEHVADDRGCLREIYRVLKPGGLCLISTPNRAVFSPGKSFGEKPHNVFHYREYTLAEFMNLLAGYFQKVGVFAQYADQIWPLKGLSTEERKKYSPAPPVTPHFFIAVCRKEQPPEKVDKVIEDRT